jgi:integrase
VPNLTEKLIASLRPRDGRKQYDVFDSKLTGLGLCYSNGGARTFFVFWRDAADGNRRVSIGRYDKGMSVNEARAKARTKLAEINDEAKTGILRLNGRRAPTLGDLIDRYLAHARSHVESGSLVRLEGIARRCFNEVMRAQKLQDIDREQIEDLHQAIGRTRGKCAANNWYRLTRSMFNLAIDWRMNNVNPCRRVRLFRENVRTRHLSHAEAEKLNNALLKEADWRWRAFFPLLLLLGLRKSELLTLTWDRVDFDNQSVTIDKRKNKEPLKQPLVSGAPQILAELPSRGNSRFVFPGNREGHHLANPDDAWQRIRDRAGLRDVRIHDLRHSFASFLINANVPISVVSKALGHRSIASSQRYAHIEHQTVRAAMERGAAMALSAPEQGGLNEPMSQGSSSAVR